MALRVSQSGVASRLREKEERRRVQTSFSKGSSDANYSLSTGRGERVRRW